MKQEDIDREARRVLEPLRYSPVAGGAARESAGHASSVALLSRIIERAPAERAGREARRRWRRVVLATCGGSMALAALALLWVTIGSEREVASGQRAALTLLGGQLTHNGAGLAGGVKYSIDTLGRLRTPESSGARFVTDEGIHIGFDANSTADLTFAGATRRVALNRGKIELSVPKLEAGTSLAVATPDAVVTVHGTQFSVEIRRGTSCVRVTEGRVSVARGDRLEQLVSGQDSGCESPEVTATSRAPSSAKDAVARVAAEKPQPVQPPNSTQNRGSARGTLNQENRLFRSALAAEQAGEFGRARLLAERLLRRYPTSPMAPDARRILRRVSSKETRAVER